MKTNVIFRGVLYFLIAFLGPVSALLLQAAHEGVWPSSLSLLAVSLGGLVSALTALRSYVDGTNERAKHE